jgi:hypothetical protein
VKCLAIFTKEGLTAPLFLKKRATGVIVAKGKKDGCCRKRSAGPGYGPQMLYMKFFQGKNRRVGVAGFEPTTPSTPRKCATRLRYTPILTIKGSNNNKFR